MIGISAAEFSFFCKETRSYSDRIAPEVDVSQSL